MVNSTAVVVTEVEEDGLLLKFNLTGVEPCIANCIRRSLLCEVIFLYILISMYAEQFSTAYIDVGAFDGCRNYHDAAKHIDFYRR